MHDVWGQAPIQTGQALDSKYLGEWVNSVTAQGEREKGKAALLNDRPRARLWGQYRYLIAGLLCRDRPIQKVCAEKPILGADK
jgi:hypothetical protein